MEENNKNPDVTIHQLPKEEKADIYLTREEYDVLMKKLGLPNRFEG